jgi:choline dehydrogenase-like flavoprotein
MPFAPSANTNATVYAIAERAAALIQAQSSAAATPSRTA